LQQKLKAVQEKLEETNKKAENQQEELKKNQPLRYHLLHLYQKPVLADSEDSGQSKSKEEIERLSALVSQLQEQLNRAKRNPYSNFAPPAADMSEPLMDDGAPPPPDENHRRHRHWMTLRIFFGNT